MCIRDRFKHPVENPELILDVKDLHYSEHGVTKVDKVNFSIRGGEILGVAGVQGNGCLLYTSRCV